MIISSTAGVDLSTHVGVINSISISDGHNDSATLTGTLSADLLFNNPDNTFVGDFIQEALSSGSNILHVTDSSIAWDGGSGNDTIIASGGGDFTISGGAGDDTYFVDNALDKVVEATLGGNDTIDTTVSYTLPANVENLVLIENSGITGTAGSTGVNTITDTVGGNTLVDSATGSDTLIGLAGGDTFVLHNAGTHFSTTDDDNTLVIAYNTTTATTLNVTDFVGIENIKVTGTGLYNLTGDANDNLLVGNASNNTLTGGGGNDTLNGGAGADTMIGGTGSDTFFIDNTGDVIVSGGGIDTVMDNLTAGTFTMASGIDTLIMGGTGALHAVGNGQGDYIVGNSGNNVIEAGVSVSDTVATMAGGAGADTYIVDNSTDVINESTLAAGGLDLVIAHTSYDLSLQAAGVEKLTLAPGAGNIDGTGNSLANVIVGNEGDNTLDGGAGIDTLQGGLGNDTYIVDVIVAAGVAKLQDMITDTGGADTLELRATSDLGLTTPTTLTLATGLENFDISDTGSNHLNITGNAAHNVLTGNDWDNVLTSVVNTSGNPGDELIGGLGNDTYVLHSTADVIIENPGEGTDTAVIAYNNTLAGSVLIIDVVNDAQLANVENVTITGTGAFNINGGPDGGTLIGNASVNTITGGLGNDTLDGGLGHDILTGNGGANTFVFTHLEAASALNSDTITDFSTVNGDVLNLHDILSAHTSTITDLNVDSFVHLSEVAGNTVVSVNATGSGTAFIQVATLQGVTGLGDAAALFDSHNLIV